jgi:putative chitinase
MSLTLEQLCGIMPSAGGRALDFLPWLDNAMEEFGIATPACRAAFLAQFGHETGQLASISENLNYSADGLANTWPTRFAKKDAAGHYLLTVASTDFGQAGVAGRKVPNAQALELHRQPEKIANVVYANRMGNGDVASGDGWRYRGAGGFQLTGKDNPRACAARFGMPLERVGDWLRTPEGACRSAAWFWTKAGCNELADVGNIDGISDMVNIGHRTAAVGDAIGYADRRDTTTLAMKELA